MEVCSVFSGCNQPGTCGILGQIYVVGSDPIRYINVFPADGRNAFGRVQLQALSGIGRLLSICTSIARDIYVLAPISVLGAALELYTKLTAKTRQF
jgi:hypothetical protein